MAKFKKRKFYTDGNKQTIAAPVTIAEAVIVKSDNGEGKEVTVKDKLGELQGQINTKAPISLIPGDKILRGNFEASISGIDLNSKKGENGEVIIRGYNLTNAPTVSIASVLVLPYTRDWVAQLYYDISTHQIYTRTFTDGNTWNAWKKIVTIDEPNLANYPIGSIYMSTNSTSPASLFGGTWEQIKNVFLLGAGDKYNVGVIGGEENHTLTLDEAPSHQHYLYSQENNGEIKAGTHVGDACYGMQKINASYAHSALTDIRGGDKPHNNMPPYLAVNIWKRTA